MHTTINVTGTGSLVNAIYRQTASPEPEPGMGVTVLMWTDRKAGTIEVVSANKKRIEISYDKATRTDTNGRSESQRYTYERGNPADTECFTLRKNGRWVRRGESAVDGTAVLIGKRITYHDYTF